MRLSEASGDDLDRLRILAGVFRGQTEWLRVNDDRRDLVPVSLADSPWTDALRAVWSETLVAVCDEHDRCLDETDNLNASWGLLAGTGSP